MARETGRSTLAGIAAEAGVSVSAVSKVLNGRTDVAAGTRARIASLLRRDGYQVASRLGFGVVDLLIASLHSPWAEELLHGTVQAADEAGTSVVVSTVDSPGEFAAWLNRAAARGTDGALLRAAPAGQRRAAAAGRRAHPAGGDRPARGARPGHPVGGHHELAGRPDRDPAPDRAGAPPHRHHRRPGAPVVQPGPAGRLPRRPGGGRAARRPRSSSAGTTSAREGRPARRPASCSRWPQPPTAIVAGNDPQAFGVLQALGERGLRAPDDLSVVGFDDVPVASWATPAAHHRPPAPRGDGRDRLPDAAHRPAPVPVSRITSSWPPPWSSGKAPARRPGLYKRHLG